MAKMTKLKYCAGKGKSSDLMNLHDASAMYLSQIKIFTKHSCVFVH